MPRRMTPGLQAAVTETGRIISKVTIRDSRDGDLLLTTAPENPSENAMKVVSGSITTDELRAVQGTGQAQLLVDEETADAVIPLTVGAAFSPTAPARIHVQFHAPGDDDLMDYGVYEIEIVDINYTQTGVVLDAEISDNSRRVERARFWRPVKIPAKTLYDTAFHTLLDDILGDSEVEIAPTKARTGLLEFDTQADRLAAVREMATAIGFRFDWNVHGRGNVRISEDIDTLDDVEPVWTFIEDGNAKLLTIKRLLTDERTYNGVIAMGETTGSDKPPVRAEWWDRNPHSPTYFDPIRPEESQYGPVPFFYVSEFITNKLQALLAARARLPKVLGLVEILTITAIPHPGIVPGDPIQVVDEKTGISGLFIVENVTMPLTGATGRMSITCRDRRLVE